MLQNNKMLYCHDLLMKAVDKEKEGDVSFISLVKSLNIKYFVFMVSRTWCLVKVNHSQKLEKVVARSKRSCGRA